MGNVADAILAPHNESCEEVSPAGVIGRGSAGRRTLAAQSYHRAHHFSGGIVARRSQSLAASFGSESVASCWSFVADVPHGVNDLADRPGHRLGFIQMDVVSTRGDDDLAAHRR